MSSYYSENHHCEFLHSPDPDLVCPICHDVVTNPHTTTCCKNLFCLHCLLRSKAQQPHCPMCRQTGFTIQSSEDHSTAVQSLPAYCTMRGSGCNWTGPLQDLTRTHLTTRDGGCTFVVVACPDGCGHQMPRGELHTHREGRCPLRPFPCPHCQEVGTYQHITVPHRATCPMFPLTCPHGCSTRDMPRCQLEHHTAGCPLALIRCSFPGCTEMMHRRDEPMHNEESTQRHLALLASAVGRMTRDLQEQQKNVHQSQLHQQQVELAHTRLTQLERRMNDHMGPPIDFTMTDYDRHRRHGDWWCSPAFRTHFSGYSMYLAIQVKPAAHQTAGNDAEHNVAMELRVNDDDLNDHLVWPQWCAVTVQVLNQLGERDHYTQTMRGEMKRPMKIPSSRCWAVECFIACSELGYHPHKHTQYLKEDCLKIRVGKIRLQDTDFMYDA